MSCCEDAKALLHQAMNPHLQLDPSLLFLWDDWVIIPNLPLRDTQNLPLPDTPNKNGHQVGDRHCLLLLAHSEGFEPPAYWFVVGCPGFLGLSDTFHKYRKIKQFSS